MLPLAFMSSYAPEHVSWAVVYGGAQFPEHKYYVWLLCIIECHRSNGRRRTWRRARVCARTFAQLVKEVVIWRSLNCWKHLDNIEVPRDQTEATGARARLNLTWRFWAGVYNRNRKCLLTAKVYTLFNRLSIAQLWNTIILVL